MFASSTTTQSPIHRSLPQAYAEILNDLNQKVISAQPLDVLQFCANYFSKKLEDQRIRFLAAGKMESLHKRGTCGRMDEG